MLQWLDSAVFYEIYPISFFDSNGDGKGDLNGITQKVGYIKSLGVDAVWLNPIYKSPFKDGGYDISDYYEIDKRFGTMEDLDRLIGAFHENGIRVVLDLVVGHTSNQHKWFKESSRVRRNRYSDYYIWTNSNFESHADMIYGLSYRDGGYMKNYYASQPALNYGFEKTDPKHPWKLHYKDERLKPLREEIMDIMRFYLDKGVDGFRVDMAADMVKDGIKFDPANAFKDFDEGLEGIQWFWNKVLGTMRKEYKDKVYIGEWCVPQNSIGKCGFDMDFLTHDNFEFNVLYRNEKGLNLSEELERGYNYFSAEGKGSVKDFVKYVEFLYGRCGDKGCFTAPTGTHDEIRMPTGKSEALVKTVFAFLLTVKQIPFVYYGDEIGIGHNYNVSKDGGSVRTGARTPMQWTDGKNRGFSERKTTYLPTDDKAECSVEAQEKRADSLLNTVRKLISLRRTNPALFVSASQRFLETEYPVIFERSDGKKTLIVAINPSDKTYERKLACSKVLVSENVETDGDTVRLKAQSFIVSEV